VDCKRAFSSLAQFLSVPGIAANAHRSMLSGFLHSCLTLRPDTPNRVQGQSDNGIQSTEVNGKSHATQARSTLVEDAASLPERHAPVSAKQSSFLQAPPRALPNTSHSFALRQPSLRTHRDCGYVVELAMAVQRSVNCDAAMEQ
jgi:hypothetical protein